MRFKIGFKKEAKEKEDKVEDLSPDILIQSQAHDFKDSESSPKFALSWILRYKNGVSVKSEYTPRIEPSISNTLLSRLDPIVLTILGKNLSGNFEIELVRIKYDLVHGFGYIGEQCESNLGKEKIIGMWIKIFGEKTINIYHNGFVKEI